MNDPGFEVYPQHRDAVDPETQQPVRAATGEYGWRFRAANGKISAVGGEGFTRREDAHRAVGDFVHGVLTVVKTEPIRMTVKDVDE